MAKTPKKKVAGASKRPEKASADRISVGQAAELVMVTPRRIQQLVREGYIPAPISSKYDRTGVVQGYIRSLQDEKKSQAKNVHENKVRDARARKLEIEIAEAEGRLIELEEHDAVIDELVGMVREGFGALPARVSRDPELRSKLEGVVNDILGELSTRAAKRSAELRSTGAVTETDAEDDAG